MQLFLILIFLCAILIKNFESFEGSGGVAVAQAAMGFSSTEEIVAVLILMSLLMVLLQVAAILFEGARAYQREVHAARW